MQQTPHYVYPFRRHSLAEGVQAEVVLIRSTVPLDEARLLEHLAGLADRPIDEYRLIDAGDDVSVKLDTWDQAIESCRPSGCGKPVEVLRPFNAGEAGWVYVPCEAAAEYMAGSAGIEPAFAP